MDILSNLKYAAGSRKNRKRVGRGEGSGHGNQSTRGMNGQMSRSGAKHKAWFEGGQMPLQRRVPKFGFTNPFAKKYVTVNLGDIEKFIKAGVMFGPAKAANAGGVATSGLEMSQNSMRYSWTFEEVDAKLKQIMINIFHNAFNASKEYGVEGNLVMGANIAGFLKVANAMLEQGIY